MKNSARKPLRLWPGVVIVILQWLVRFAVPAVVPEAALFGLLGELVGGLAIVLWWLFLSRAPWSERLGAVGLMIVVLFATKRIVDVSIATGAQGMLFPILAIPILSLALVAWAVATRRLPDGPRRVSMVATILLACGVLTLVRTGGFTAGSFHNDLHWRWAKTPEERLMAKSGNEPGALPPVRAAAETPEKRPVAQSGNEPAALPPGPAGAKDPEKRPGGQNGKEPAGRPPGPPARRLGGAPGAAPAGPGGSEPSGETAGGQTGQRAGGASAGSRGSGDGTHLARLSRTPSRRCHSRRADQNRLDCVAAGRAMAPAGRTGLVVLRGSRRPHLHPRAARSR